MTLLLSLACSDGAWLSPAGGLAGEAIAAAQCTQLSGAQTKHRHRPSRGGCRNRPVGAAPSLYAAPSLAA